MHVVIAVMVMLVTFFTTRIAVSMIVIVVVSTFHE